MASTFLQRHKMIERNITLLAALAFGAVTIGGIVEIAPLFWIDNTIEKVQGMRPYTPLEQAGRDIYICGPGDFTTAVEQTAKRWGADSDQIHSEVFAF